MKYIKGFDTLRGIAILLVLFTHLGLYQFMPSTRYVTNRVWPLISGLTGVQIFFTLSGFLITNILIHEKVKTGMIRYKFFYIKRFIRLLPALVVLYSMIVFVMCQDIIPTNKIGLIFSMFYCYNFIPNFFYSGELAHTWSLAVEEQFYIFWPFAIAMFSTIRSWIIIVVSIIILCIMGTYFLPTGSITHKGYTYVLGRTFKIERWFIPASAPIMVGSLFGILTNHFLQFFKKKFEENGAALFAAGFLFISPLYVPTPVLAISSIIQALGISIFLTWIYFNQSSKIVLLLNNRITSYIGKISYGIYVYQGFFLTTGPGSKIWFQKLPVNIFLTILIAILSYEYLEKICLGYKKNFQLNFTN